MAETQLAASTEEVKNVYPGLNKAMGNIDVVPGAQQAAAPKPEDQKKPEEEKKPVEQQAAAPKAVEQKQFNIDDLDENQKSEMLAKLTGGKFKSLADLEEPPAAKTKEQLEAEAQKRKSDVRAWALETGKAKPEDFDQMAVDKSKSDRDIALAIFTQNLREEDKTITEDEALELFKDAYHEGAEENKPRLYAQGQKDIKKMADAYRKEKFSPLENLDGEYDQVLQSDTQFKAYKAQVKKVVSELPKELSVAIPYKNLDGTTQDFTYQIPVDDKVLAKLLSDYSKSDVFVMRNISTNGKIDEASIAKEMNYNLKAMMFDAAIPAMLAQNTEKVEAALMVQLGNKRGPALQLNNGQQATASTAAPKANDYSGLRKAMNQ